MITLRNLLILLSFQIAGEFLHRVLHFPLSGPLLGMVLLFLALAAWGGPAESFQATTRPLLASLALLFVPAGVGVITRLDLLQSHWVAILVGTIGGAAASILAAGWTMVFIEGLIRKRVSVGTPALTDSNAPGALEGRVV